MKVKICGLREAANILAVANFQPDLLGFIFYDRSPRFVADNLSPDVLRGLPATIAKVGVFVDAPLPELLATATRYGLDYAQLHGHETPAYCRAVRAQGLQVIKAFSIADSFDFSNLTAYEPVCDLFLFDTKGAHRGGNGRTFDWRVLAHYHGPTPFLLSGGLGPANAAELLRFHHPRLAGYDFNSLLETAPGLKDVEATGQLLTCLQDHPTPNL